MASLAAIALSFGALMGAGPVAGWAAGTGEAEAANTTAPEAPATAPTKQTTGIDTATTDGKASDGEEEATQSGGDTSAEPKPETEASEPAAEVGTSEAPAKGESAPSEESVPKPKPSTGSKPRAPADESAREKSPKNADSLEFATPVVPEEDASKDADAEKNASMAEDEATEAKLVAASGTFTAPDLLLWPIDVTVRSDSGGDFSANFKLGQGESHTWEGQLPEGTGVTYELTTPGTELLIDVYNNNDSMDMNLGGAGIVTGKLTGAEGAPRAGVHVEAVAGYPFDPRPIETNAEGRYQFIVTEPAEFAVVVDGISQSVVGTVGTVVTVEQPVNAQQITVRLTDPKGNDFEFDEGESAQLSLSGPYSQTSRLAAGENSVVFNAPAGSYKLSVVVYSPNGSLENYYPGVFSEHDAVFLEAVADGEPQTIDFPVDRGGSLSGTFVDENGDLAEIPNGEFAVVEIALGGVQFKSTWVNEGDAGFSFSFLAPGEYDVSFDYLARGGDTVVSKQVTVVAGANASGIEFVVPRSNTVSGTLVNSEGEPVVPTDEEMAELTLESEDGGNQWFAFEPGQSTFEFQNVQTGRYTMKLSFGGHTLYYPGVTERENQESFDVSGDLKDLRFNTSFGSSISGTVTGADGQPVAGTKVYLHPAQSLGIWDAEGTTKTNAEGRYEFSRLAIGNYAVRAGGGDSYFLDRWHSTQSSGVASPVIVSSAQDKVSADVALTEHGGKLGITWPEAKQTCNGTGAEIYAADGNYVYFQEGDVLAAGEYKLVLRCGNDSYWWDGAADAESSGFVTIDAGETTKVDVVAWESTAGGTISGTVTIDGKSNEGGVHVTLSRLVKDDWGTWDQQVASMWSDGGNYSFEVNEPGEYVVRVEPQGAYQSAWHDGSTSLEKVSAIKHDGTEAKTVDIALKYPVSLTVRMLDAATNAPVDGEPQLWTTGGVSASTQGNVATLKLLQTGEVEFGANGAGYLPASATVALPTQGAHTFDLYMDKGAKLGVSVLADNNSLPLRNVHVQSLADGSDSWAYDSQWTNWDGRAEFVLTPGQYWVCVPDAGLYVGQCEQQDASTGQLVTVGPEGLETTVRLTLGGQIKGFISDSDGNGIEGVTVGLAKPGVPAPGGVEGLARSFASIFVAPVAEDNGQLLGNTTITNAQGEYTLPPVDPGEYALFAYREDLGTTWYPASGTFTGSELLNINPGTTLDLAFTAVAPADGVIRTPEQSMTTAFRVTVQPTAQKTAEVGEHVTLAAWAAGDPLPTVRWQRSDDDGATWADVEGQESESFGFTAETADNGAQFRAFFTQNGVELASNATTLAVNVPAVAPDAVGTIDAMDVTDTGATLQWQAPKDGGTPIQGYSVRVYAGGELIRTLNPGNVLAVTIGGLEAKTDYTATVTAHNAVGTAPASEAAAFTTAPTPATVPGAPGNVSIE
ncbi:carboxypeptidase regulatory-like domain-containing protein, partial [Paeniglutamicibacter sp. ORCA_105]|uniref:carboxypeptidase regulatory-like domain-containing protein n=1 Tax=Paeniglutamicibacter sp. ORCA_105 TaxID=3377336 RepID=UPI0038960943